MTYSIFAFILLLVSFSCAAPQGFSACGNVPSNPAAGQIGAQYLQIPGCSGSSTSGSARGVERDTGSQSNSTGSQSSNTGSNSNSSDSTSGPAPAPAIPAIPQTTSDNATAPVTGGEKCPSGFRNTVFNTGAPRNEGWPQTTWDSLTSNGVDEWIGFALSNLSSTGTYNTNSGPAETIPSLNAAQIHQVMDPTEVTAAVQLLQDNPPQYLTLFNEPDYSYGGATPLTSATDAAKDLQPLFNVSHPKTTYLSPAVANATSDWLPTSRDACDGCMSQIPIIAMHLYNQNTTAALALIEQLHGTWPDKRIWITELAPGTGDCTLDVAGIVSWLNVLVPQIVALGYVDRIFWNCGESSPGSTCKTDLTNNDGSPTDVLKAYSAIC